MTKENAIRLFESAAVTLYKQKNSINFIEDNLNISR